MGVHLRHAQQPGLQPPGAQVGEPGGRRVPLHQFRVRRQPLGHPQEQREHDVRETQPRYEVRCRRRLRHVGPTFICRFIINCYLMKYNEGNWKRKNHPPLGDINK